MKNLITTITVLLCFAMTNAYADDDSGAGFEAAEVHRSTIRVSNDGTGVITRISCEICKFSVVKITDDTVAYVGGVQMTPSQALKKSKGKIAIAKFTLESREVLEIRFFN